MKKYLISVLFLFFLLAGSACAGSYRYCPTCIDDEGPLYRKVTVCECKIVTERQKCNLGYWHYRERKICEKKVKFVLVNLVIEEDCGECMECRSDPFDP